MPPEALSLVLFILEEAIKEEPAIAGAIKDLFAKADPTPADWAALRLKVATKSYADYVPDSVLPPELPAAPAPAIPAAAPIAVFTGQATDPSAA